VPDATNAWVGGTSTAYFVATGTASGGLTLDAGASPGVVSITGSLTLTATDTVLVEAQSVAPGDYDQYNVSGTATLGNAKLVFAQLGSLTAYQPAASDTITVVHSGTRVGSFNQAQTTNTLTVGTAPYYVATGKLDAGATVDIVTANFNSNTVGVILSNGNGTYKTQRTYDVGTNPYSVTLVDIGSPSSSATDGKLDIVVTNSGSNTVGILYGVGDGTFGAMQTFAVGTTPQSAAVGDIDGDGKVDLIVANRGSNTVSVLL